MIDSRDSTPEAALLYLEAAIGIMDSCSAPPDIAAHADLAKARLQDWIADLDVARVTSYAIEIEVREGFAEH